MLYLKCFTLSVLPSLEQESPAKKTPVLYLQMNFAYLCKFYLGSFKEFAKQ